MSNVYPAAKNNYLTGSSSPTLVAAGHAAEHNSLETKLGIDNSTDTTSIDYLLKNTSSSNPGHKHTLAQGATDVTASAAELNYVDGVTSSIQTQIDTKAPIASPTFTGTVGGITKAMVGLTNVDDTSDATKNAASVTLTNKRITKRIGTTTDSATPTPNADTDDDYHVTALAQSATFGAPTGTPTDGQPLIIRIKDDGTARALDFNAIYRFSTDISKPTTTTLSKTMYLGFKYNSADSKWDCLAKVNGF